MKKLALFLSVFLLSAPLVFAEMIADKKNGEIIVKSATTQEVENLFKQYNYQDYAKAKGKFPRIYLNRLPNDWENVPESDAKHRTFIRILLPLVLKVNEQIIAERDEIQIIALKLQKGENLSPEDDKLLEEKAEKYNIFTHLKGDTRKSYLVKHLLENIDIVPPSIMIATAAIYTDWGTSRLALEANSLYRDEIWYADDGIKPFDDVNSDYRYKSYATLEECIASRALKLNSHVNYEYLRHLRKLNRQINQPAYGGQMAHQMLNDSNLKNIAGLIDYTFTFYKLNDTDYFPSLEDVP